MSLDAHFASRTILAGIRRAIAPYNSNHGLRHGELQISLKPET